MRRALVALLLVNIVFFGYTRLIGEPASAPAPAEPSAPIPRLALLSELKSPPGPSCVSVGPFTESSVADQASSWLRNARHAARSRSAEVDAAPTYRVAVTTKTLQEAARISMRLKAAGVSDIEVAPPGSNQTEATVSLGIYSDRDHADRRVSDLRRLGVAPAIIEQSHKATQWWLDVPLQPGDPALDVAALGRAVTAAAGATTVPCPGAGRPAPASPAPRASPDQSPPGAPPAKLPGAPA